MESLTTSTELDVQLEKEKRGNQSILFPVTCMFHIQKCIYMQNVYSENLLGTSRYSVHTGTQIYLTLKHCWKKMNKGICIYSMILQQIVQHKQYNYS